MEKLSIYLITWNVAAKAPEQPLDELLGPRKADVYIIGLQEVKSQIQNLIIDAFYDDPWTHAFKERLRCNDYVKVRTVRMQGIVLVVFTLRKHMMAIRDMEMQHVKTGLGGFWGNKGCVSLRMTLHGVSICIVNSHLTPHDQNLKARISDYNTIIKQIAFRKQKETSMVFFNDYVFWLGDHNFRIDESVDHQLILDRIAKGKLEWLQERDQLKNCMQNGQAFSELIEPKFEFAPTYKFHFKSSVYDFKRRPAWTDRILYKVTEHAYENIKLSVEPKTYTSMPNYTQSDHKPVISEYNIKAFADYSDRVVNFQEIKIWIMNKTNRIMVEPSSDVRVNDFDWIAIFHADFSSLDDYLSFMYVNPLPDGVADATSTSGATRRPTPRGRFHVTFPDNVIRTPGKYCLLYFTHDSSAVLGKSKDFFAEPREEGRFFSRSFSTAAITEVIIPQTDSSPELKSSSVSTSYGSTVNKIV